MIRSYLPVQILSAWILWTSFLSKQCMCLFEEHPRIKGITTIEDYSDIKTGIDDNRLAIIAVYHDDYDSNENLSNEILESELIELESKYQSYFQIYSIDCDNFSLIGSNKSNEQTPSKRSPCRSLKKLPTILYIVPSVENQSETPFTKSISIDNLISFAMFRMPFRGIRHPHNALMQNLIFPDLTHPKVVFFTNEQESSMLLKTLSAIYFERLLFLEINESQNEEIQQFKVEQFPTLIVLRLSVEGKMDAIKYSDALDLQLIIRFLDLHALPYRVPFTLNEFGENIIKKNNQDTKQVPSDDQLREENLRQNQEASRRNPDPFDVKTVRVDDFYSTLMEEESMVILHIVSLEEGPHASFPRLQLSLTNAAISYELALSSEEAIDFARDVLNVSEFPAIKVFPFSKEQKIAKLRFYGYGQHVTSDTILSEINFYFDSKFIVISNENQFQQEIQSGLQKGEIVQILFHDASQIPLEFKIANEISEFKEKVKFISYSNPPEAFVKQFGIKQLPRVAGFIRLAPENRIAKPLEEGQVKAMLYEGKFEYKEYSRFLRQLMKDTNESRAAVVVDSDNKQNQEPNSSTNESKQQTDKQPRKKKNKNSKKTKKSDL